MLKIDVKLDVHQKITKLVRQQVLNQAWTLAFEQNRHGGAQGHCEVMSLDLSSKHFWPKK